MSADKKYSKILHDDQGLTLIEVAILIIALGLLVIPIIEAYKIGITSAKNEEDIARFGLVTNSVNSFVVGERRYPLPASLIVAKGDANDGAEAVGGLPAIQDCSLWPTTNGVCTTGGANPVLIGAVPFKAIGINDDNTYDYFGRRILYAVTASQTATYIVGSGGVITRGYDDEANRSVGTLTDTASSPVDMILVSHGESGQGAFLPTGAQFAPCPTAANALDSENCNFDSVFILQTSGVGTISLAAGDQFYDDKTDEQRSVPEDDWLVSETNSDFSVTNVARIGIGTQNPDEKVHVVGDLLANSVLSDEVCDNGGNCFRPSIIGGVEPAMDCNSNSLPFEQAVVDVGNNQVYCGVPVNSSGSGNPLDGGRAFTFVNFGSIDCADTAELMRGIDANGDPICDTP